MISNLLTTGPMQLPQAQSSPIAGGISNPNFTGVDLSGWNPPAALDISAIIYTNAINIPGGAKC